MRLVLTLAALAAAAALGWGELGSMAETRSVRVLDVVDGDTIGVRLDGKRTPIRVIGIDTPELRPQPECFARSSTRALQRLVGRREVKLVFDAERHDRYRRVLAYVELSDGRDAGAELLRGGFARTLRISPNVTRAERYATLERRARRTRAGLWGRCSTARDEATPSPGGGPLE